MSRQTSEGGDDESLCSFSRQSSPWSLLSEDGSSDSAKEETPEVGAYTDNDRSETSSIGGDCTNRSFHQQKSVPEKLPGCAFRKTRPCKFHAQGFCSKGDQCDFAHDLKDLQALPNLFRTRLCLAFQRTGKCKYPDTCRYAHGLSELRTDCAEDIECAKEGDSLVKDIIEASPEGMRREADIQNTALANDTSDWKTHAATGFEFCVKNTFLVFRKEVSMKRRRSASC
jgi:hypothetical protein